MYLGTFSKTFAPGVRVGWAAAPPAIRDKLVLAAESAVLCHSSFSQLVVGEYLGTQPWREQVKDFREIYRLRRDAMLDALSAQMPDGCRWTTPAGGFYVWLQLPEGINSKAMLPRAVSSRVAYVPGTGFYADGGGTSHLRLSYCFPARPDQGRRATARVRDRGGDRSVRYVRSHAPARPDGARNSRSRRSVSGGFAVTELDHVVVLAGGLSPERDVSLRSGRRVRDALEEAGVDARIADADASLIPALLADPPTAVFPAIHGSYGEDGAIREILALIGVPYVGSVASACRSAFDKPTAKALVAAAGIATPESVTLPREIFHDLGATAVIDRIIARLGLPLFVKPARGGSSLGASPVRTAAELPTAVVSCFAYGDTALIERFIEGTEIAVSVVDLGDGPCALPAVEIVPAAGQYDYTARYTAGQTAFYTPARLPDAALDAAAKAAASAHSALGLRDISRTDMIVSESGEVFFLEVNVSPGMTETSTLPMALDAAGHAFGTACLTLLRLAAARGD